jgi:hypothetical protein
LFKKLIFVQLKIFRKGRIFPKILEILTNYEFKSYTNELLLV